jgi:hypothetical protein
MIFGSNLYDPESKSLEIVQVFKLISSNGTKNRFFAMDEITHCEMRLFVKRSYKTFEHKLVAFQELF